MLSDVIDQMRDEFRQEGRQDGLQEGRQEGIAEGLQEGRRKERREYALRMLRNGYPAEEVMKITGLSRDELQDDRMHESRGAQSMLSDIMDRLQDEFWQEGLRQGIQEGRQEGIQEGRQEERRECARRMLRKGYPTEEVMEVTGLSRDEVQDDRTYELSGVRSMLSDAMDRMQDEFRQEGRREGIHEGRRAGLHEGIQKGRQKERREHALRMLQTGYPAEEVMESTDLPREEIQILVDQVASDTEADQEA